MKKLVIALLVMAFAIAGASIIPAHADICPGGNKCTSVDIQSADGAIGSTTNSKTLIGSCRLMCASTTPCHWALQQYASVSTGAIVRGHIYSSTSTSPADVVIFDVFPNGAYGNALTGTVTSNCHMSK